MAKSMLVIAYRGRNSRDTIQASRRRHGRAGLPTEARCNTVVLSALRGEGARQSANETTNRLGRIDPRWSVPRRQPDERVRARGFVEPGPWPDQHGVVLQRVA